MPKYFRDLRNRKRSYLQTSEAMLYPSVTYIRLTDQVSFVLLDGVFKDPSREVGHDLREDIFAFVHDLRL